MCTVFHLKFVQFDCLANEFREKELWRNAELQKKETNWSENNLIDIGIASIIDHFYISIEAEREKPVLIENE